MAIPLARLIRDQNIDSHFSGGAPLGGKADAAKPQKKGGLGGGTRKALNDISNSEKPSALQASKKHYSNDVISIGKDIAGKSNILKAPTQKGKIGGGRKALSDVTNAEKPSLPQVPKKIQEKKLSAISEDYFNIDPKEEGFLHNHQECVKEQKKTMDKESFLKLVGLDDDGSPFVMRPPSLKLRPESPLKLLKMQEMLIEDRFFKCAENEIHGYYSPACGSPTSPKSVYAANWKEDKFQNFALIDTPKLLKR